MTDTTPESLLPANMNDLMSAFEDEDAIDKAFAEDIASLEGYMPDLANELRGLGLPSEADQIHSLVGGDSFQNMSSFIDTNIGQAMDNVSLHQSVSGIETALGSSTSVCPGLDKAFGPFLSGRAVQDAVAKLKSKIPQMGSLNEAATKAQGDLQKAQSDFAAGVGSQDAVQQAQGRLDAARVQLSSTKGAISDLSKQVHDSMSGVNAAINDANQFVEKATAKLTRFTEALKVNSLVKDPCAQSIIGAVGSSRVLGLL
jgi:hypothetical protein